jgi:ribonuclease HI
LNRRGGKLATNRLSYGAATSKCYESQLTTKNKESNSCSVKAASLKVVPGGKFNIEVYAIKAGAVANLNSNYTNRNIYILSKSQAAIRARGKHQITSKLVWDCHQSLTKLARHNRLQLIWVPGHEGIVGNETADQLARTQSEHPFTGPGPACGIPIGVAKKRSRTGRIEITKTLEIHNWSQTGKGTYARVL